MMDDVATDVVNINLVDYEVNKEAFMQEVENTFGIFRLDSMNDENLDHEKVLNELLDTIHKNYEEKEKEFGEEQIRELERVVMLKIVDSNWMDHIDAMDDLKDGIGLQAYGQKDPVVQYRIEGMDMFEEMSANIKIEVVKFLLNARKREGMVTRQESARVTNASLEDTAIKSLDGVTPNKESIDSNVPYVKEEPKIGRNDPCPCGSGKKYKNCCGKNA